MAHDYYVRVYRVGEYRNPAYTEHFKAGTDQEAENRAGALWDTHTPVNGVGWRLTLKKAGRRSLMMSIGW